MFNKQASFGESGITSNLKRQKSGFSGEKFEPVKNLVFGSLEPQMHKALHPDRLSMCICPYPPGVYAWLEGKVYLWFHIQKINFV
jgi:hypothetical protein